MLLNNALNDPLYDHFDSDEHRLWKEDRLLRRAVPMRQVWRGCLGLAILLHDVERTEYPSDDVALVPNDTMTWLALRDVPRNHFPGSLAMNRREVQYVNAARAMLRYGMPALDFTRHVRDAWDLRFMPFGRYDRRIDAFGCEPINASGDVLNSDERPREFAVLNRLNAAMTRFAFAAADAAGRPMHRAWARRRPANLAPFRSPPVPRWMPRAYLAFDARHERTLTRYAGAGALRLPSEPKQVFFAAGRVDQIAAIFRPQGLWWDLQPCIRYVDGELEAAVLPPIPLAAWNTLRFRLPGEVLLDARIADPRFSVTAICNLPEGPTVMSVRAVRRKTVPAADELQAA